MKKGIGIPVSVGIASSKTQAKYAVDIAKKTNGICCLSDKEWSNTVSDLSLAKLWGVGGQTARKLKEAGYSTVEDFINADLPRVRTLFGVNGERLQSELRGKQTYSLNSTPTDQKSIMSSKSFKTNVFDIEVLEDAVAYHARHIAADLRRKNLLASSIRVTVRPGRHSDFVLQGCSLEISIDAPTSDTFLLLKLAQKLLKKAFKNGVPYKKVGVSVPNLVSDEVTQDSLFDENKDSSQSKLLQIVDSINAKTNRELVTVGDRNRGAVWQAKKDLVSPSYTTKWTDVAIVKASS